jgi:hypothetical protein
MEFQRIALVWGKDGAKMLAYLEKTYPGCEIITYHPTGYDTEFPNGDYTRLDPAYDIPDFRQSLPTTFPTFASVRSSLTVGQQGMTWSAWPWM